MVTELAQRSYQPDKPPAQGGSPTDALRPALNDYENFTNRANSPESRLALASTSSLVKGDKLTITPWEDQHGSKDKSSLSDSRTDKDKSRIELNPETQEAKDKFVQTLENRFRTDSRLRDNPNLLKDLEARLDKMDQRILHERVRTDDGAYIDQQEQLEKVYSSLSRIGADADKLTYTGKDGNEYKVFFEPYMVNNVLASAIVRGADPEHFYNQGSNKTCATESINRQGHQLLAGQFMSNLADVATKGEFETVDNQGKPFICKVDKASLTQGWSERNIYLNSVDARDSAGKISDIMTAQLGLDLRTRDIPGSGGEGRLKYCQVSPTSQRDTGERVIDTTTGKVLATSPSLAGEEVSNTKQALYGHFISKDFGKETTIVSDRSFDVPNATEIKNGAQLAQHLKTLEEKGWKLPTLATHTDNYHRVSGHSWHATSIKLGKNGGIDFVNNWGGAANFKDVNADQLVSWMDAPPDAPAVDRVRGDHVFNPDDVYGRDGNQSLEDKLAQKEKPETKKDNETLAQAKKAQEARDKEIATSKQQEHVRALAEIDSRLATLPENSPLRANLIARKQLYQNNLAQNV